MGGCESQVSLVALQRLPSCLRKRKARAADPATMPSSLLMQGQKNSSSGFRLRLEGQSGDIDETTKEKERIAEARADAQREKLAGQLGAGAYRKCAIC